MGYCFFHLTFYSLLHQFLVKLTILTTIPNTAYYTKTCLMISFDMLISLLHHTHGSTIPRLTALLFGHKRFVWQFHSCA